MNRSKPQLLSSFVTRVFIHLLSDFLHDIFFYSCTWDNARGQKWNPLRQRLDSFDYSVDQHVVGSLLFTPVLLLLPTTSVFYIFFTFIDSCISLLCILLELSISLIHATPYSEIFLWVLSPARFPSGLWLEIRFPYHQSGGDFADPMISSLQSNYAKIGKLLKYLPLWEKKDCPVMRIDFLYDDVQVRSWDLAIEISSAGFRHHLARHSVEFLAVRGEEIFYVINL